MTEFVTPQLRTVLKTYQDSATKSLHGPGLALVHNLKKELLSPVHHNTNNYHQSIAKGTDGDNEPQQIHHHGHHHHELQGLHSPGSPLAHPSLPPPPEISQPVLSTADTGCGVLYETMLEGKLIGCFLLGGEMRLCIPQILNNVLTDFTLDEIYRFIEEQRIFCSQCTPEQLNEFKAARILPDDVNSAGLITRTNAERLCSALLHRSSDRRRPLTKGALAFRVFHRCFGKAEGLCMPELFSWKDQACIECLECRGMFAPQQFVCHVHRQENGTLHWGFDSSNWRAYLQVCNNRGEDAEVTKDNLKNNDRNDKYTAILDEMREQQLQDAEAAVMIAANNMQSPTTLKRKIDLDKITQDKNNMQLPLLLRTPNNHMSMSMIDQPDVTLPDTRASSPTSCGHSCKPDPIDIPLKKTKQRDETYMQEYKRAMMIYQQQFAFRPWAPFGVASVAQHHQSHQLSSQNSTHHQNVPHNQSHTYTSFSAMNLHPHSIHYINKQSHDTVTFAPPPLPPQSHKTPSMIASGLQTSVPSSTMSHTPVKTGGGVSLRPTSPSHNLPYAHHNAAAVSSLAAAAAANCNTHYMHHDPPVLQHPERVVRDSESDHFERSFQPNVALAPRRNASSTHVSLLASNSNSTTLSHAPLKSDTIISPLLNIKQERPTTPLEDETETLQPEIDMLRIEKNSHQPLNHHQSSLQPPHQIVDDQRELKTSMDNTSSPVPDPHHPLPSRGHQRTTPPCSPIVRLQLSNKNDRSTPSPMSLSLLTQKSNSAISPECHSSSNEITSSTSPVPEMLCVPSPLATNQSNKTMVALQLPPKPDMDSEGDLHCKIHPQSPPRQLKYSPSLSPTPPISNCINNYSNNIQEQKSIQNQILNNKHQSSVLNASATNRISCGRNSQIQQHQEGVNLELELSTDTDDDSLVGEPDSSNNGITLSLSPQLQWNNVVEALVDASDAVRTRVLNVVKQLLSENSAFHRECSHLRQQLVQCQCNARHLVVRAAHTTTITPSGLRDDESVTKSQQNNGDGVPSLRMPAVSVIENIDSVASISKDDIGESSVLFAAKNVPTKNIETIGMCMPPKKSLLNVLNLRECNNVVSDKSLVKNIAADKDTSANTSCELTIASVDFPSRSGTMQNSASSNSYLSGPEDGCSTSSSCISNQDHSHTKNTAHNIPIEHNVTSRDSKNVAKPSIENCIQLTVVEHSQVVVPVNFL